MADALSPASSPSGLPPVRRLNKLPLVALGAVLVVVVLALLFAALGRGGAVEEPAEGGPPLESIEVRDPRPRFEDVIEGHEERFEIEAAPAEPAAVEPAQLPPAPARPPPAVAEIEEYRLQLLRDAVAAGTTAGAGRTLGRGAIAPESDVEAASGPDLLGRALAAARPGEAGDPNLRARKAQFADRERRFGYSVELRRPAIGRHELKVGTVVPALLLTGIDSDLPGVVLAQVARAVRDTRTGTAVLIPRGARLVGSYDHHVAMGQRRVMAGWHRVEFPDGSTLDLGGMPAVDGGGFTGLKDQVENRYMRAFGAATMLSVLGAGAQISQPAAPEGDARIPAGQQVAGELGRQWGELGRETARRNLDIQPTLKVRPGYRFNVMVTKDLILPPYRPPGDGE